jgi:hypothetical protein
MAKHKHHKGKKRRRHVGALSMNAGSPLVMGLAVAGGFFADQFIGINNIIDGYLPGTVTTAAVPASGTTPAIPAKNTPTSTMNNVAMAGEIGLGGYLMLSKRKSMLKTMGGGALVGLGLRRLAVEMGVVKGFQEVPVLGKRRHVRGFQNTPVLGSAGYPAGLSGYPAALGAYVTNGMGSYKPIGSGTKVMGCVDSGYSNNGSGYSE